MFPNLSRIPTSYGPCAPVPVSNSDVTNEFLWNPKTGRVLQQNDIFTLTLWGKTVNYLLLSPFVSVLSDSLSHPPSRLQMQKNEILCFWHIFQKQHHSRQRCLRRFCHLPSLLCDLNPTQCHTWGTGTIKSTNQQMPGCSAQSAPVWQSVLLVITASCLGSLNIHPPSAGSRSNSVAPVAGLFT